MATTAEFLDRVRARQVAAGGFVPQRPVAALDKVPDVERLADAMEDLDLVAHFAATFGELGGHVHRCAPGGIEAAVAEACGGRGPVLVDQRLALTLDGQVLSWPACGLDAAAAAQVGVVHATAAIASTGSIVVDSDRAGRLVSLLPRVAVFVIDRAAIVRLTGDVLREPSRWWPDGLPTNVVLVSGPSRSADIEMSLVVDVHGPGEVHAAVVS